jgi:glycosyltransferase involved in cell wall biosynthesis
MANKSKTKPLLSILVPVYNEETTILKILEKVTRLPIANYEVLVVNDASKDRSKSIIDKFSLGFKGSEVRLRTFSHPHNRGKGAGIKTGIKYAKGKYFIIQDADLEYDPSDIPALVLKATQGNLPVVYGSRFLGKIQNMPAANYYANRFYNFLLRRLYKGTSLTDMHTCYKMVETDTLRELKMTSEGFDYATELISKLLKRGIPVSESPINFYGRTKKDGKKIGYKDGVKCITMIFKYKFSKNV